MSKTQGTPRLLKEAIMNSAKSSYNNGDKTEIFCEVNNVCEHIRDFLSQQFAIAMMKNHDQDKMLKELFERIIAKDLK